MEKKPKRKITALGGVLAKNIRIYRAVLNFSQEKLAEASGLKRTYVGSIERGEIDVRLSTLAKIAKGLDIDAAQLLTSAEAQLRTPR
jgi:transcriptional regulator with XRE-family HTH domain